MTKIISTFFYIGYFPLVPGTFASAVAVLIFYFIKDNPVITASFTLVLIVLGFIFTSGAEKVFRMKDPKYVVIDEVAGMSLSLLFLPYYDIKVFAIGFILFRILDTLKPFPAARLEDLKGSAGIMCDDLIAGIYANIILQCVFRFTSFIAS